MSWKRFFSPIENMDVNTLGSFISDTPQGTYTLLDVRQPAEYEKERIPGSKLIPLPELPGRLGELHAEKPIIVYWAVGGRSRAATQILKNKGFKVHNLKGGIRAWQGQSAKGPEEMGMIVLIGDETPREVIALAYGLEMKLQHFYQSMASRNIDDKVSKTFQQLADIEERHKNRLVKLGQQYGGKAINRNQYESQVQSDMLEGGFTLMEMNDKYAQSLNTVEAVVSWAMMLEAQGMDLYMRYAGKIKNDIAKTILFQMADEEKLHLESLAGLLGATRQ